MATAAEKAAAKLETAKEAAKINLVNNLETKEFKSGKAGFYAQGKITIDGDRYQSQIMLVKIEKKS